MIKFLKNILFILEVSYRFLLERGNENPYSAKNLLNNAEKTRKTELKKLFNEVIYELYSAISEASNNGKYRFETGYHDYVVGLLQEYNHKSDSIEWENLKNKIEKDFEDVKIEYNQKYPWFIEFDWSNDQ